MNEEEEFKLTAKDIATLKRAVNSILGKLNVDEQAITNIWKCLVTEQERLSELEAEQQ